MDPEDRNLKEYYDRRSSEYDLLYEKPDRQKDLAGMREQAISALRGKKVLEIACGTGYWTEVLSGYVDLILATDTSETMMEVARKRTASKKNVSYLLSDAYTLDNVQGEFNAAFCGYWVSHVKRKRMGDFLSNLHGKLLPGSSVVLLDNIYVDGSSTPISKTDSEGNTYQMRRLANGETYEILKNFLGWRELMDLTENMARKRKFKEYQYYWVFEYSTL